MNYDFDYSVSNSIATITLSRPEVLNALTLEIYAQLRDLFAALERMSPQNRLMTPAEVALVAGMLVHDDARGITGQAINVDGGMVMY